MCCCTACWQTQLTWCSVPDVLLYCLVAVQIYMYSVPDVLLNYLVADPTHMYSVPDVLLYFLVADSAHMVSGFRSAAVLSGGRPKSHGIQYQICCCTAWWQTRPTWYSVTDVLLNCLVADSTHMVFSIRCAAVLPGGRTQFTWFAVPDVLLNCRIADQTHIVFSIRCAAVLPGGRPKLTWYTVPDVLLYYLVAEPNSHGKQYQMCCCTAWWQNPIHMVCSTRCAAVLPGGRNNSHGMQYQMCCCTAWWQNPIHMVCSTSCAAVLPGGKTQFTWYTVPDVLLYCLVAEPNSHGIEYQMCCCTAWWQTKTSGHHWLYNY
jgi:hypothetical protein